MLCILHFVIFHTLPRRSQIDHAMECICICMDSVFVLYLVTEVICNGYFPVNKEQDKTLDF